jgi:hypothetical protein
MEAAGMMAAQGTTHQEGDTCQLPGTTRPKNQNVDTNSEVPCRVNTVRRAKSQVNF